MYGVNTMFNVLYLLAFIPFLCSAVTIKGRLDISPKDITHETVVRSSFKLYQVGNITGTPYKAQAYLKDIHGHFEFTDVPIEAGSTPTYYQLVPQSLDYNLKPNRVLIEIINNGNENNVTINAYQNIFGKEHFPSPDIIYPDELQKLDVDPDIVITYVQAVPWRSYYVSRNPGMFSSGPLASIVNSKYKLAAVITIIALMLLPILVEKFDPEVAQAVREQKLTKVKEQYGK
ncbi:HGL284Cp [Eremothecium sinecaudum]|uniref:Protein SOP4 n=1 Tax=Eremothecium sinecaudum TaxID=45286 RepID=A0A0X8HV30_9SACH|nr:HGL284Cp [Eremothecium sinecaudum]AMD22056.1 HGL284Cp [Eremothecium sinecaudum]